MHLHELITHNFDYNPFESKNIAIKPSLFIDLYKSSHKNLLKLKNKERSKKIFELYQTSLFVLGLTSIIPKEYWVKIHDSEFPDSEIIFFGSILDKRISTYLYKIENAAPKDKNIIKVIMDKMQKKYSVEDPVLLLLYLDQDNSIFDYKSLLDMIKRHKNNPFGSIWSICRLNEDEFEIAQIFPIVKVSRFSLSNVIAMSNQQPPLLKIENKYLMKPIKKHCKVSLRVD